MSRYLVKKTLDSELYVGWDNPMNTFFCQYFDTENEFEDNLVWQMGRTFGEYCDLEKFVEALADINIIILEESMKKLQYDKDNSKPRSQLQDSINQLFLT